MDDKEKLTEDLEELIRETEKEIAAVEEAESDAELLRRIIQEDRSES